MLIKKLLILFLLFISFGACAQTQDQFIDASKISYGENRVEILKKGIEKYPQSKELLYLISSYFYQKEDYITTSKYLNSLLKYSDEFEKEIIKKKYEKVDLFHKVTEQKNFIYLKNKADKDYLLIMSNLNYEDNKLLELINNFNKNYGSLKINDYSKLYDLKAEINFQLTNDISMKKKYLQYYGGIVKYDIAKIWKTKYRCNNCDGTGKVFSHSTYAYENCSHCGGSGRCASCGGDGKVPCYEHDSNGDGFCTICKNRGWVRCYDCNGSGICPYCKGLKRFKIITNHYKRCPSCKGLGYHQ